MRNLILALAALVVIVFVTEIFLRATHAFNARVAWTEPDPEIGYRFSPGRAYWFFAENDHPVTGRINALGWRDHERTRAKEEGVRRVAVIGDSYVEAFQVELDSTFVAIAERRLDAQAGGGRVECLNFGRSGMTTTEEWIVLTRDVLGYDPDVVVLVFTPGNDIADMHPATDSGELRPYPRPMADGSIAIDYGFARTTAYRTRARLNPLKQRSALVSLLAERYNVWRRVPAREERRRGADGAVARDLSLCTAAPDSAFLANYAMSKRLIAEMAGACRAAGVDFWLAAVPPVPDRATAAGLRMRDASFDAGFFDRDLAALADSIEAGFVPLAGRFLEGEGAARAPLVRSHWTYAGHRLVAAALVEALAPSPRRP